MMRKRLIVTALLWGLGATAGLGQEAVENILPLDAEIAEDGRSIDLNWFDATPPRVGSVTVKRRLYGQIGGQSWTTIAEAMGPVMRYTDDTIKPGVTYEYQVLRYARDIVDAGYWLAGTALSAQPRRGTAYVVVDETLAAAIAPRLDRFERDLTGDGWTVRRHSTPRGDLRAPAQTLEKAIALRTWLIERYNEDPFGQHAVILVGHVPIVKSGKANPDGHTPEPHATDLFYADMDGRWTLLRNGGALDNRVPGDFIEMQVGRIDFAPVSDGRTETEIHLLRAYFDKNHHWRMGYLGDLRQAYSANGHLAVEQAGLRNITGPGNITTGGHHDVGEEKPWLWGVDFGDWKGARYATDYANKAVFTLNFGSGKQKFDAPYNAMTALLAQPWYPVSVGWGARPAWWLHHMALGGSIGDVHLRTVNNGTFADPYRESMDYFPPGRYLMRNAVWVNLLGDPTLHGFPLAPPHSVTARRIARGTELSWQAPADPDTQGYHVFRAAPGDSRFARLTGADPVTGLSFVDPDPVEGARYMVRSHGLKRVHAGSFHTLSQGAFVADIPISETNITLEVPAGRASPLPDVFNTVTSRRIHAIIEAPEQGRLSHNGTGWLYQPPAGFTGEVSMGISVSDRWQSRRGSLTLSVSAP